MLAKNNKKSGFTSFLSQRLKMKDTNATATPNPNLPHDGINRFKQLQAFIPVSRGRWMQLVRSQRAPQAHYLSPTRVLYRDSKIHKRPAEPINYCAEVAA